MTTTGETLIIEAEANALGAVRLIVQGLPEGAEDGGHSFRLERLEPPVQFLAPDGWQDRPVDLAPVAVGTGRGELELVLAPALAALVPGGSLVRLTLVEHGLAGRLAWPVIEVSYSPPEAPAEAPADSAALVRVVPTRKANRKRRGWLPAVIISALLALLVVGATLLGLSFACPPFWPVCLITPDAPKPAAAPAPAKASLAQPAPTAPAVAPSPTQSPTPPDKTPVPTPGATPATTPAPAASGASEAAPVCDNAALVRRFGEAEQLFAAAVRCGEQKGWDSSLLALEQAADNGSAGAARTLAQLYDPIGFQPGRAFSRPDPLQAAKFYRAAADRGDAAVAAPREALRQWLEQQAAAGDNAAPLILKDFWPQ